MCLQRDSLHKANSLLSLSLYTVCIILGHVCSHVLIALGPILENYQKSGSFLNETHDSNPPDPPIGQREGRLRETNSSNGNSFFYHPLISICPIPAKERRAFLNAPLY